MLQSLASRMRMSNAKIQISIECQMLKLGVKFFWESFGIQDLDFI